MVLGVRLLISIRIVLLPGVNAPCRALHLFINLDNPLEVPCPAPNSRYRPLYSRLLPWPRPQRPAIRAQHPLLLRLFSYDDARHASCYGHLS